MNQGRCAFVTSSPVIYTLCGTGCISDAWVLCSCQGRQRFWGGKTHSFQRCSYRPGITCLGNDLSYFQTHLCHLCWPTLHLTCLPLQWDGQVKACSSLRSPGEAGTFLQHRNSVSYSHGPFRSYKWVRSKFTPDFLNADTAVQPSRGWEQLTGVCLWSSTSSCIICPLKTPRLDLVARSGGSTML